MKIYEKWNENKRIVRHNIIKKSYKSKASKSKGANHWMLAKRRRTSGRNSSSLGKHLRQTHIVLICLKPCTPKPDQIWSNHYWLDKRLNGVLSRLSTWSLEIPVTSSSLCPSAFSVLDKKATGPVLKAPAIFAFLWHRKAKIAGAFRTWTSSCKWCKWWSRLTNCQLYKTKTTCQSLHVIYVMSIHFICLSPGEVCHFAAPSQSC